MNLKEFYCQYLTIKQIENTVDQYIKYLNIDINKTIDIELIIEKIGLNIDLKKLSNNFDAIYIHRLNIIVVNIDRYLDDRYLKRLRFSLAHELGHYILHKNYLEKNQIFFQTLEEYFDFVKNIPEKQYKRFEKQANIFANRLLVPKITLHKLVDEYKNKNNQIDENLVIDLSNFFQVSDEVIDIRLEEENIKLEII